MSILVIARAAALLLSVCAVAVHAQATKANGKATRKQPGGSRVSGAVARALKSGNRALAAGRYDEAIARYDEGLAARGDDTSLLTNKAEALSRRGVGRYDAASAKTDPVLKRAGFDAARKDWTEAADHARRALALLNAQPPAEGVTAQAKQNQSRLAAHTAHAQAMRFVATKVDTSRAGAAWDAYRDLIAVETDPARKSKSYGEALRMLIEANETKLALDVGREVLAKDPDNLDANLAVGLALFVRGDSSAYQEVADRLQMVVDRAPETDPWKANARAALEFITSHTSITPKKTQ